MASQDRADIYARITAEIVAAIEAGTDDYSMPWHHDGAATARPVNVASGKTYRGVNVLALWVAAIVKNIRRAFGVPTGNGTNLEHRFARVSAPPQWCSGSGSDPANRRRPGQRRRRPPSFPGPGLSGVQSGSGRRLRPRADHAPVGDRAHRPRGGVLYEPRDYDGLRRRPGLLLSFGGQGPYARVRRFQGRGGTLQRPVHEGVHATAAKHRLNRDLSGRFGSEAYAMEEVVAEAGACMILADLEIAARPRPTMRPISRPG